MHILEPGQLNTYDVLVSDDVVFTQAAFESFVSGPQGRRHRRERRLMATRHPSIASKAAKAAKAARVAKAKRHATEGKNTVETPLEQGVHGPA